MAGPNKEVNGPQAHQPPAEHMVPLLMRVNDPNVSLLLDSAGRPIASMEDLMGLDRNGRPRYPSITLTLPNEQIPEPMIIGGPSHMSAINIYLGLLKKLSPDAQWGDIERTVKSSLADLVIRPEKGGSVMCIRSPALEQTEWPKIVDRSIHLLKGMGLPEDRIRILDFSEGMVSHALRSGNMGRLFPVPRTLIDRIKFIHDSEVTLGGDSQDPLNEAVAYYGIDGGRQMFSNDFTQFILHTVRGKPQRAQAAKALITISDLARNTNNLGAVHLTFFQADRDKFNPSTIDSAVRSLGALPVGEFLHAAGSEGRTRGQAAEAVEAVLRLARGEAAGGFTHFEAGADGVKTEAIEEALATLRKGPAGEALDDDDKSTLSLLPNRSGVTLLWSKDPAAPLDAEDTSALVSLAKKLRGAVPTEHRTYNPESEPCREELLQRLIGPFSEGIRIPGLRVNYLGRGMWLNGPKVTETGLEFPPWTDSTVVGLGLRMQAQFEDLEYMAVYSSLGSASRREQVGSEKREVYLVLLKQKSDDRPFIMHARKLPEMSSEDMNAINQSVTAIRLFGIRIPEHNLLEVKTPEGKKNFLVRPYGPEDRPADKLVIEEYAQLPELIDRMDIIGKFAGRCLVIGRANFMDGDEGLRTSKTGRGYREVVLMAPTGAFSDVETLLPDSLARYSDYVAMTMVKAHTMGVEQPGVEQARDTFVAGLVEAVSELKHNYQIDPLHYEELFMAEGLRKKVIGALERLRGVKDIAALGETLRSRSTETYGKMSSLLSGLKKGPGMNEVVMALDQTFLAHPREVPVALGVLSADERFASIGPREREERVDVLRLNLTVRHMGLSLGGLNDYIRDLKEAHGKYAFARFEDECPQRFPGLNLRGKDAKLIDKVFANPTELEELRGRGYISD